MSNEIMEAQVIEETTMATTNSFAPANLFGARSMADVMVQAKMAAKALAAELEPSKDRPRPLYKQIGERRHVYIEGWTLLGSLLGVTPVTVWTRQIASEGNWRPPKLEEVPRHSKFCKNGATKPSGEQAHQFVPATCETYGTQMKVVASGEGGWEARVEARTLDGRTIGAAEAECRWDEPSWRDRDSYALRSMAQTRASSKALRMPLGFIVELAGYNATPAEEIPDYESEGGGADTGPRCPVCNSAVWDNRADNEKRKAEGRKPQPSFKCKNRSCTGSEKGDPWITWHANFFDRNAQERNLLKTMILGFVESNLDVALQKWGEEVVEEDGSKRQPSEAEIAKRAYLAACAHVAIPDPPGPTGATELDIVWNAARALFGFADGDDTPFENAERERIAQDEADANAGNPYP